MKSDDEQDDVSVDSEYAKMYNPHFNTFKMEYINETKPYKIIKREEKLRKKIIEENKN